MCYSVIEQMFGKEHTTMTEKEKEMIEMIKSYPDKGYALQMAIEIFTLYAEPPEASQEPSLACQQECS